MKTTSKAWRVQNVLLALSIGLSGSTLATAAQSIPGTIEAENFDTGGEGVGYHDTTPTNLGGQYRSEGVDIIASSDPAGGLFDVAYFVAGEWLAYTVNVANGGNYAVEVRAATSPSYPNPAYHVEVDGRNVTGTVTLPSTGGWSQYQWLGKRSITIPSGTHKLKIVSERPYMMFNSFRLTALSATPFLGSAVVLPGTIEAENYDVGGEGVAYHDTTPTNLGGQYRSDGVDIIPSSDSSGGIYDVAYFDAGEWLSYTVSAPTTGNYDLEVRAATSADFPNSAYHIEIDGQNVTGSVVLPNTGGWSTYQWLGRKTVSLSSGVHALKIVSETPYFMLNSIRVSNTASAPPPSSAHQLFSSGFEGAVTVVPPVDCWGTGCWQDITGFDPSTQFSWPGNLWGGGGKFLMLTDPATITPATLNNYMLNRVDTTTGHRGNQTQVLFQQVSQNANGTAPMGTSPEQNEFQFLPQSENGDLYLSYWVKLQGDLVTKMTNLPAGPGINGGGTWRAFFAVKTGGQVSWGGPADNGDYRIEVYVMTFGNSQPYWSILGDNNAGGGAPLVNSWSVDNHSVPVPVGQWFKFEIFWHRSAGSDGRVWMAINGQVVADHRGANFGAWSMPINRVMAPMLYSGSTMPIYQWVDDLEVWDSFPSAGGNNPPYAPH